MPNCIARCLIATSFSIVLFTGLAHAQDNGRLADSQFSDENGFFRIVPPANWRVQSYPDDPRGKVAFMGPDGAELRILAKTLDHDSFDAMLAELKEIEKNIKTDTNINVTTLLDMPAVHRRFALQGTEIQFYDLMIGSVSHNIMYSASPRAFDRHHSIAQASINTYQPILRDMEPGEARRHSVARSLRLARLFLEQENYGLSAEFVDEGLNVDPDNPELLELKTSVASAAGTTAETPKPSAPAGNTSNTDTSAAGSDNEPGTTSPFFYIALSIVGALMLMNIKSLASGTAAPGFAMLTVPVLGMAAFFGGLFQLFEQQRYWLLALAVLLVSAVFSAPVTVPLAIEKIRELRSENAKTNNEPQDQD